MIEEKERINLYRILFVIVFAVSLGFCMVNPFFSIYAKDIGASGLFIAFIFSGYSLSKILFTPLLGNWSDERDRRYFIIAGLSIYSIISFCYFLLPNNLFFLIFLRFIQGMGAALVRPITFALVGDITTPNEEGIALGTFDISFYSALSVGPILGGFIKDISGFQGIFGILFALCFLSLLIAFLAGPSLKITEKPSERFRSDYALIIKNRTFQGLFCFIFARSFGIGIFVVFIPIVMSSYLHLSNLQIGLVMASGTALTTLLLRPMGRLSDRVSRKGLIIIGGGMAAILTFFLPFADHFLHLLILSISIGFFSVLSLPSSYALLIEVGKRYGMGLTIGLFDSVMNIGFIVAFLLGGFLMDIGKMSLIFHTAGLIGILGICFFSFLCLSVKAESINVLSSFIKKEFYHYSEKLNIG